MEEEEFTGSKKKNNKLVVGVIIVILIIAAVALAGINMPNIFSSQPAEVLVIGQLSPGELIVLDNLNQTFRYSVRSATDLESSSIADFGDYSIILIDQTQVEKSISSDLSSALKSYVEKGGELIVVKNSITKISLGLNGVNANDSLGWKTTIGELSPAECVLVNGNEPSCKEGTDVPIAGRIVKQEEHPIMYGIDIAPTADLEPYQTFVLPIQASDGAKTIAYFDVENTPQTYPAILEKKHFPLGKVVYFNYDPGMTPTILKNTLMYLK